MKISKAGRKMIYQLAVGIKKSNPTWTNHSCLEEAFIKCAGLCNYTLPLESMLKEYRQNKDAELNKLVELINN